MLVCICVRVILVYWLAGKHHVTSVALYFDAKYLIFFLLARARGFGGILEVKMSVLFAWPCTASSAYTCVRF